MGKSTGDAIESHIAGRAYDTPERMEQCLNCPYPEDACFGDKKCKAQNRIDRRAAWATVRYGMKKGMSPGKIAEIIGMTPDYVINLAYKIRLEER